MKKSYRAQILISSFVSVLTIASCLFFLHRHQYPLTYPSWMNPFTAKSDNFDELRWGFQLDMPEYDLPAFDSELVTARPMNWRGSGHETYATFYASRNASLKEPYFLAAQQIIYRLLWSPASRSSKHTMTVFVSPFISQEQRDFFTAAGAIVREIPIRSFIPDSAGAAGRLKDMFSKLEMWNHTEFSRIAYLDSDAFPLANIDRIFTLAKHQRCHKDLLPEADLAHADAICDYTFAGYRDAFSINAGVLVFSPNEQMYERLTRESLNHSNFDNGFMEQALLNFAYDSAGPFPPSTLPHAYNGGVDVKEQGKKLYVAHHKLWNTQWEPENAWFKHIFNDTWQEMLQFYKTEEFREKRLQGNNR